MDDIPSAQPQIPISAGDIQLAGPQPETNYSTTPALDMLNTAYKKGLVGVDDIQSLFAKGSEVAANAQQNQETIAQSKARLAAGLPEKTADLAATQIQAIKQTIPSSTAAQTSQNIAAAAAAQLETVKNKAALPLAQWEQSLNEKDNGSGNMSRLLDVYLRFNPTGQVPLGPDGMPDPNKLKQFFGIPTDGSTTSATANFLTGQGVDNPIILRTINQNYLENTPDGKGVAAQLGQKNIPVNVAMYDDKTGRMRTPMEMQEYAQKAPNQFIGDSGNTMSAAYNSGVEHLRRLDALKEILTDPKNIDASGNSKLVGPGWKQGTWSGQDINKVAAYLGMDPSKLASQQQVDMALKGEQADFMLTARNVRNIYEFKTYAGQAPELSDTMTAWNTYFKRENAIVQDSLKKLEPSLENYKNQLAEYEPPAGAGGTSSSMAAGAGVPKTQKDFDAAWATAKPGDEVQGPDGQTYTK